MIKQYIQEGFLLKNKGYYKRSIEAFYKALEIDNNCEELLLEIADLYYLMGNEERSIEYVEQILDKTPIHIGALKLLKCIFMNKRAYAEAEQTAKNIYCISCDVQDQIAIFELLIKQGKYEEIFEYKIDAAHPLVFYYMGLSKFKMGEYNEAEILTNMALDFDKKNSQIQLLKGEILLKKNKLEDCIELMEKMDIVENDAPMQNWTGLVYQLDGKYKKALGYFMNAIRLAPANDEYYYNCASTYFKMGEIKLAKKYYNLAVSLNPNNQNYHFALANLYYSEKHYKRAMEELNYDFFEARLLKSIILYDTGYVALAKKELNELEKISPDNELIKTYQTRIEEELKI